ncbi:MAG TPA: Stp1/IreP family PP2C-type Ser/Thr phosphatase [Bryobacteraceae bacterium]|nr:Stp1/IreP family PP2C-type Ser/Thr phosphatase [Bryobacteraceae bacterium]
MRIRPGIELANLTDTGCQREKNEDYYCYAEPDDEENFRRKGRLAIVADGMGGHEGGQVASSIAVETVRDAYLNHPADDPGEALAVAFQDAHAAILDHARAHPELHGMGTTCTAAVIRDGQLFYSHVGDSRLYQIRGFSISQLTEDHSQVGRLLREGLITPEEAAVHPERNVLTAALGMDSAVPLDFPKEPIPLEPNDVLLICTDGLHGLVGNEELLAVAGSTPPRDACQELVRMAKDRGGFDNITVQILRIL